MAKNTIRARKLNNASFGKGGFTLVELVVVMGLMAILTTMIVSFVAITKEFASESKEDYEFFEDCFELKEAIGNFISENDASGKTFSVAEENLSSDSTPFVKDSALDTIADMRFDSQGDLIKCTVTGSLGQKNTFVFSVRCATVENGGGS